MKHAAHRAVRGAGLIALAAAAVLVPAGVRVAADSPATLIEPGAGIGPVRLGVSIEDVVRVIGRPKVTAPVSREGLTDYSWADEFSVKAQGEASWIVTATRSGKVVAVRVAWNARFQTKEGLHTGMVERDVRRVLGAPPGVTPAGPETARMLLYGSGIVFYVTQGFADLGVVSAIQVLSPADEPH